MSVSQAFPPLGQEYEPFLYAIVCNEGNGMPLTVVSAIARSGADPWKEAARIAKMPKIVALDALARMIPERSGAEGVVIANRLFALLPLGRENKINCRRQDRSPSMEPPRPCHARAAPWSGARFRFQDDAACGRRPARIAFLRADRRQSRSVTASAWRPVSRCT